MRHKQIIPEWDPDGLWWFNRRLNPSVRLICLSYAGGAAAIFRPWANHLPETIEVVGVEYGGRGARFREPLVRDLRQAATAIATTVAKLVDRPFALFGHSMGGMVAYELARQLRPRGCRPVVAFVSACPAPDCLAGRHQCHMLPDEALLAKIRILNGTPKVVLDDPDMIALMLPIVRADFAMFETYTAETHEPFACDVVAFAGEDDETVDEDEVRAWGGFATGSFALEWFPGDHFFINSAEAAVLASIQRHLRPLLRLETHAR